MTSQLDIAIELDTTSELESQLVNIVNHTALRNEFYDLWMSQRLNIGQLAVVAKNYGAWVKSFPDALSILVATTEDLEAKTEYVKTLFSEMGYGDMNKVHYVLLNAFFTRLAQKLGNEGALDCDFLESNGELLCVTQDLIAGERDLYRDKQLSIGAQLALEWQAYTMLRQLYEGARNYMALWNNPDEFHEACEYFYAHIGATEKEHKKESLIAVRRYAIDGVSVE